MKSSLEIPLAHGARAYRVDGTWVIPENTRERNEISSLWEKDALGSGIEINRKSWVNFVDASAALAVAEELNDPTTA